MATSIERRVQLSADRFERLSDLARVHQVSEDQIIERALDILFSLTEVQDASIERQGWSFLSEGALQRVWDNEEDTRYDEWLRAASKNPAFGFLGKPEEDVYTLADGKPFVVPG